ncbi:hypothetical protein D3C78_1199730 [compost metagenome]
MSFLAQRPSILNHFTHYAVNDQIGVTANRRSEVGIVFRSQSEMACALRIIFCLLHGTQHHCANYGLFFSPLDLLQQILQSTWMN